VTYEALDIVVVPFPFTDQPTLKRRPALIISSTNFNDTHQQSVLAMITTSRLVWPSDVVIEEWRNAGLIAPCKVRFKLFTLDHALILRRIGVMHPRDGQRVKNVLSRLLIR
jgi:mRNA interferase MazF